MLAVLDKTIIPLKMLVELRAASDTEVHFDLGMEVSIAEIVAVSSRDARKIQPMNVFSSYQSK